MRRGMSLVEVSVAVAILLGVLLVLASGLFQVFGCSIEAAEQRAEERRRQVLEIRALRADAPLASIATGRIEGDVAIVPASSGWFAVGLGYRAVLDGRFTTDGSEPRVSLVLPPAIRDGWQSGQVDGSPVEPDDEGVLVVPGGSELDVRWHADGLDELSLDLPEAARTEVQVAFSDGTPLGWEQQGTSWHRTFHGPVTIAVAAGTTRFERALDLALLGALGMLLFGIGFVYVNEGERPGSLDDVHLGGALLLALDYALFFAIALVLLVATELPAWSIVVIGAVTTLPLLGLHLVHLTDVGFTLRRALPGAVASWMAVGAWLAYPEGRLLLVLAWGVAVLAFVTTTYEPYVRRRQTHRESERVRWARIARERRVELARTSLRSLLALQPGRMDQAEEVLGSMPAGLGAARGRVARSLDHLELWMGRASSLLRVEKPLVCDEEAVALENALERAQSQVQHAADEVDQALVELEDAVGAAQSELQEALYQAMRTSEERADPSLECAVAELQARVEQGEHDLVRLAQDARALVRRADVQKGGVHCLACGTAHADGSRFCSGCGGKRPPAHRCSGCGASTWLPPHLLTEGWSQLRLHCAHCGTALCRQGVTQTSMS